MHTRIDLEQLKNQLNLREQAIQQGAQDLPATTDTTFDAAQETIVAKIRNISSDILRDAEEALAKERLRRKELAGAIPENDLIAELQGIEAPAQRLLVELEAEQGGKLRDLRKEEFRMQRQYNAFRATNLLTHRQAHYPDSTWMHWAIIAGFIFLESIMNSYFYKEATDSGYLGGIFIAAMIAVVNVVFLAYPIGRLMLPQFHHVNRWPRAFLASVGGLTAFAGIILINLAAAHTRVIIASDQTSQEAFTQAIKKLKTDPFGIDHFEAWILFVLGIGIAAAAIIKGYKSDDPYPGFGDQERLLRKAKEAYRIEKEAYIQKVISTLKTIERNIESRILSVREMVAQYQTSLETSTQLISNYRQSLSEHNKCCNALLSYYRAENLAVRVSAPPPYFHKVITIDGSELIEISKEEKEKGRYLQDLLLRLEPIVGFARKKLDTLREQYLSQLTDLHRRWEAQVKSEIEEENSR